MSRLRMGRFREGDPRGELEGVLFEDGMWRTEVKQKGTKRGRMRSPNGQVFFSFFSC